jgi:predicted transposase/invertase (TIGR01784 family)
MTITKFLDPKNNFAFTQIFGTEKNKDILVHFLNDILQYEGKQKITEVTFLKTIQDPEIAAFRQSIVDVLCKDQNGDQVIVEMQLSHHKGFEKRAQYYAAKAYSQQILKEDENHKKMAVYAKLKGVIFLAIADFIMFPKKKDIWKSEHLLLDKRTYENDLKAFYFVFIELEKFNKSIRESVTLEEKWCYFFKHADESSLAEIEHLIGSDQIMKRAFEAIDQASWTEEELRTYERITKANLDNLAVEQQKLEDAEARGEAKGIELGKTEGIEIGEARGIEKTAINMLQQKFDPTVIATVTGLTLDEVLKLKNSTQLSN